MAKSLRDELEADRLVWWPEIGVGYYPVEAGTEPYNQAYFDRFAQQAETDIGRKLMRARCAMVARHYNSVLLDVGIGSGAFIDERKQWRGDTFGYDVNPAGIAWLYARDLFQDPFAAPVEAMSLWDVLEHMDDFRPLLEQVRRWLFICLPIFRDGEHAKNSKHFRRDEHFWYFSRDGFTALMQSLGFLMVEENFEESQLGRSGVMSFAFRRK